MVANCLYPGVVRTRLGRRALLPLRIGWRVAGLFFKSPQAGASTLVHLASSPECEQVTGAYFVDPHQATPSLEAQDDDLAERLWKASDEMTRLR